MSPGYRLCKLKGVLQCIFRGKKKNCSGKNTIIRKKLLKYIGESAILIKLWHDSDEARGCCLV